MSEVQIAPGIKMSAGGNTDLPPNSAELARVILWDIGPSKPMAPKRPVLSEILKKGKDGDPEYDLAKIESADALDEYQAGLRTYKAQKEEYAAWHKRNDGPVEIMFWSCDAFDALERDAAAVKAAEEAGHKTSRRYYISASTRGHSGLPNRGLPEGVKPGHGQAEQERRAREGDEEIAKALRADPVFGQQELRS